MGTQTCVFPERKECCSGTVLLNPLFENREAQESRMQSTGQSPRKRLKTKKMEAII